MNLPEPHVVTVYPATKTRDEDTNASDRTYSGSTPRRHPGHLQARSGRAIPKAGGLEFSYDAVFYTTTAGFEIDDLVLQNVPGFSPDHRFIAAGVQPMTDSSGEISHYRIQLSRTISVPDPRT